MAQLLILFAPFLIIVALIIILDDGFPFLFKQERIGKNNTSFLLYKFRSMKKGVPDIATHLVESPESLYTKSGLILRKLSIDELPQLINIVFGEMIFIGPRPALYNQTDLIMLRTKVGVHRLIPGITGWAQVNGRDELSIAQKVKYDEFYLHNKSCYLDTKIFLMTAYKVIKMLGVSHCKSSK